MARLNYDEDNFRNLRYFFRHIERLMGENALFGNTLIVMNCRQFSLINRDIGRAAGDIVLRRYFELFDDTLEDHGLICRVGGDNFAIICENNMVSEIIRLIEGVPVTYDEEHGKRVMLSSCAGVYTLPADISPEHPGEIFGPTYALSQEAKFEPETTILYMSRALSEEKERAAHVRHRFLEALEKKEFQAYYQPKVDVTTGRLAGAEALCRWYENGKLVPPGDFIPVLEQSMDICLLDFYMLEAACHDIRKWMDEGSRHLTRRRQWYRSLYGTGCIREQRHHTWPIRGHHHHQRGRRYVGRCQPFQGFPQGAQSD